MNRNINTGKRAELRNTLEATFHQQFAINQNHHQDVLFKLLTILGAVILGYGYILHGYAPPTGNVDTDKAIQYTLSEAGVALAIAEVLLILGLALTSNMALNFRRDQLVNYKIRRRNKLIDSPIEADNIFLPTYNPLYTFASPDYKRTHGKNRKLRFVNWMPEFHKIFSRIFLLFQLLCILAFLVKTSKELPIPSEFWAILRFWIPFAFTFVISFYVVGSLRRKLQTYYTEEATRIYKDASIRVASSVFNFDLLGLLLAFIDRIFKPKNKGATNA